MTKPLAGRIALVTAPRAASATPPPSRSPSRARMWWRRAHGRRIGRARRRHQGGRRQRHAGAARNARHDGIARLTAALNERYGKLDILIGNAGLGASNSPLDHFQPKEWDEVIAVNLTANWQLIRHLHALLTRSDAGRVVFITSNQPSRPRAYRGLYGVSKSAVEALARTYAEETASTPIGVNLFNPGPTRTRMRAAVMPGEDPMTLPTPEQVAAMIVPLCLPSFKETGKFYDYRAGKLLSFGRRLKTC